MVKFDHFGNFQNNKHGFGYKTIHFKQLSYQMLRLVYFWYTFTTITIVIASKLKIIITSTVVNKVT